MHEIFSIYTRWQELFHVYVHQKSYTSLHHANWRHLRQNHGSPRRIVGESSLFYSGESGDNSSLPAALLGEAATRCAWMEDQETNHIWTSLRKVYIPNV